MYIYVCYQSRNVVDTTFHIVVLRAYYLPKSYRYYIIVYHNLFNDHEIKFPIAQTRYKTYADKNTIHPNAYIS